MKSKIIQFLSILLLFAVFGFGAYSNVLEAPFYFDDHIDITKNPHIRISGISFNELKNAGFKSPASSRPVSNITFALNYYFHQYDLFGYHLVNIVVHILSGVFLFLFIKTTLELPLLRDRYRHADAIAAAAALIWLVHPLHTQSVTYIVQRMNSMAAMLFVLTLLLYVKGRLDADRRKSRLWFLGAGIAWLVSLGCKQISATLPFFVFLYEWYFFQNLDRTWIKRRMKYILGILLLFGLIALVYLWPDPLDALTSITDYANKEFTLTQRIFTQFRVVVYYISLLSLPLPSRLNLDYDFPLSFTLANPATTLLSLGILLGVLGWAVFMARKERLISFCILWFFGNLVIESTVIPLAIIFEHRTYLPSMLFPLMITTLAYRYNNSKQINVIMVCLLVMLLSFWTYNRNRIWVNPVALWSDCVKKSPLKGRPHNSLGDALSNEGRITEAIAHYSEAIRIRPHDFEAHNNLGIALATQERWAESIRRYTLAIKLAPEFAEAHNNLGNAMNHLGKLDEAVRHYTDALNFNPYYAEAHNNLGNVLARQGRLDEATRHYEEALKLRPDFTEAYSNLGNVLAGQGRLEDAIRHFNSALQLDPDNFMARKNLETVTTVKQSIESAIVKTKQGLKQDPENPGLYYNLGNLYKDMGAFESAITNYQKALTIRPDFVQAANNLAIVYLMASKPEKALTMFEKIAELQPDNAAAHYNVACVYARLNRVEPAVDWLKKSIDKGYDNWALIKTDRDLENIRSAPEYKALIRNH